MLGSDEPWKLKEQRDMKTFKGQRDVIKIEVGKTYELNNGEVHKCESMCGNDPLRVNDLGYGPFVINNVLYHQDGRFGEGSHSDLDVKRCVDEPETPKLWHDMIGHMMARWVRCSEPQWSPDGAYRIRPEPKRETVTLHGNCDGSTWLNFGFREPVKFDTHRITFDLIDGKPDCASIKMEEL